MDVLHDIFSMEFTLHAASIKCLSVIKHCAFLLLFERACRYKDKIPMQNVGCLHSKSMADKPLSCLA